MGRTHEISAWRAVHGNAPGAVAGNVPGWFLAQPTNIGVRTADQFSGPGGPGAWAASAPRRSRLSSATISSTEQRTRPGDQIDRNVNLSQSPIFAPPAASLTGGLNPASVQSLRLLN